MEIKDGFYTGQVTTAPPEGINKLLQMREQADQLYGEGNWVLSHAYGDHASDMQILSAALNPIVVDPDSPLKKLARKLNWPIRNWQ
jgi:phosphoserine phosphatase